MNGGGDRVASLDRAFGLRGALISVGFAAGAGAIHGILVAGEPVLIARLGLALASFVVLVLAGVASARRGRRAAIGCAGVMLAAFLLARWGFWALMLGGAPALADLAATPPWGWPGALAALGAGGLGLVELAAMATAALMGCLLGHERQG